MDNELTLREYEKLRTVSDYIDLINQLDSAASQVPNNEEIDKAIVTVARGLHNKIKYVVKISKRFTKKESLYKQIKTFWQRKKEDKIKVIQDELTEAKLRLERMHKLYEQHNIALPDEAKEQQKFLPEVDNVKDDCMSF